jgi:hypothetical protein
MGGDGRPSSFNEGAPATSRPRLNTPRRLPITAVMSIETTFARVEAIRQALADPAQLIGAGPSSTGGTEAPASATASSPFAAALAQATAGYGSEESPISAALESPASTLAEGLAQTGTSGLGALGSYGVGASSAGATPGARIVAAAETQIGQTEQPPGSNESPAIAEYRTATAGAEPGAPWCAYFASWAARQAGDPIGAGGSGLGSVSEIWSWAQSTGRAIVNAGGVVPQPGDLIVFGDEHVGIVKEVLPNGQIATIEGNYENKVAANIRNPGEATGYVAMN